MPQGRPPLLGFHLGRHITNNTAIWASFSRHQPLRPLSDPTFSMINYFYVSSLWPICSIYVILYQIYPPWWIVRITLWTWFVSHGGECPLLSMTRYATLRAIYSAVCALGRFLMTLEKTKYVSTSKTITVVAIYICSWLFRNSINKSIIISYILS